MLTIRVTVDHAITKLIYMMTKLLIRTMVTSDVQRNTLLNVIRRTGFIAPLQVMTSMNEEYFNSNSYDLLNDEIIDPRNGENLLNDENDLDDEVYFDSGIGPLDKITNPFRNG
jgi:hypothetical protein